MKRSGDKRFFLQILDSVPYAIVACDAQGTVIFWNRFAEQVLGWTAAELVGQSIQTMLPDDAPPESSAAALLPNPAESRQLVLQNKTGIRLRAQVSASLIGANPASGIVYTIDPTAAENAALAETAADADELLSDMAMLENPADERASGASVSTLLLRKVLDTFPFGVSIADSDGQIVFRNPAEQRIWETGSESVETSADPEASQPVELEDLALTRALRKGDATLHETLEIGRPNGGTKTILSSAAPIRNQRSEIIGGVVVHQDITEQRRIEDAERKHRTFANALSNITATLTSSLDLPTVMERILDSVGRVVPHEAVNIMLVEGEHVRVAFWRNYGPKCDEIFREKRYSLDIPMVSRMLTTGLPQLISDTRTAPDWIVFSETAWICSSVGVPIRARDEILGFLILDSSVPDFFTPPDAERLRAFAYQAAIAIENARLFSAIHDHAAELETRVAERTAELRAAKDHVEAILEHSSDGFALLNDTGVITQANPSFQQLFGIAELPADSPKLIDLVHPTMRELLTKGLQDAQTNQRSRRLELICYRGDGDLFDADVAISPLFDAAKNGQFYICNVRDVTRQKTSERELRSALEKEKQLNDLKSQFVAMVSHEFRTPLAVIQSSGDMLSQYYDRLSEERREELIARIQSQVHWLSGMLEDVMMIAKADTFGLTLELELIDLNKLCRDAIQDLRDTFGKNRAIKLQPYREPLFVEVDQALIRQVLTNVLLNAVKYSAEDSLIEVEIHATDDQAIIKLRDQGIGVPKEDLDRLFEPFYRSENVGARPGTGLGLAVVMRAVRAHRGSITVDSEVGVGTQFTVTLPKRQPKSEIRKDAPAATNQPENQPELHIVKSPREKDRRIRGKE